MAQLSNSAFWGLYGTAVSILAGLASLEFSIFYPITERYVQNASTVGLRKRLFEVFGPALIFGLVCFSLPLSLAFLEISSNDAWLHLAIYFWGFASSALAIYLMRKHRFSHVRWFTYSLVLQVAILIATVNMEARFHWENISETAGLRLLFLTLLSIIALAYVVGIEAPLFVIYEHSKLAMEIDRKLQETRESFDFYCNIMAKSAPDRYLFKELHHLKEELTRGVPPVNRERGRGSYLLRKVTKASVKEWLKRSELFLQSIEAAIAASSSGAQD